MPSSTDREHVGQHVERCGEWRAKLDFLILMTQHRKQIRPSGLYSFELKIVEFEGDSLRDDKSVEKC